MNKRPSYKRIAKEQADIINKLAQQIGHMKGILLISAELFGEDTMRSVTKYTANPSEDTVAEIIANLRKYLAKVEEDKSEA